jgi:small neutral amino acid transporter SnatA (MarC family)
MKQKASEIFPFAIAVILPPAGLVLGVIATQEDQDLGIRICVVAVIAAVIWGLLLLTS